MYENIKNGYQEFDHSGTLSTTSTKKYSFHIQFQIFLGFPGDLVGNKPHSGILVEGLKNVLKASRKSDGHIISPY